MTCNSAQAQKIYRKRILEAIAALNTCLPEDSGVQAISQNLVNACTTFEGAESVLALQLKEALCWLVNGGLPSNCDRPYPCGVLQINTDETVNRSLIIWDQWTTGFNLPSLVTEFGTLYFSLNGTTAQPTMNFLETVTLPVLDRADGIYCGGQEVLESFSAPSLRLITATDLNVSGNGGLLSYDFTALEEVEGDLTLDGQLNTTALFPSLTRVGGDIALGGVDVAEVDISALTDFDGDFACGTARLDAAQVNAILIKLDELVLSNHIVFLVGANMADPTGAGITAKNNLIGRGCTVGTGP